MGTSANFYNLRTEYGPSVYSLTNMIVFSSVYQLPFGRGKTFVSSPNAFVASAIGIWVASSPTLQDNHLTRSLVQMWPIPAARINGRIDLII